jgi:hypothetical protein
VGLSDGLRVLVEPGSVFNRVEDTAAYGWSLAVLLGLVMLIGFVQIRTGLLDYVVDLETRRQLADFENTQRTLLDQARFEHGMEDIRQNGEFIKTLRRLQAIILSPAGLLARYLLISAVLYAAVALSGRKPEYHTLMSICVYAGSIDILARLLETVMMVYYRTPHVQTSLAMLVKPGEGTMLAAIDPLVVWFWGLVGLGLVITRQLGRRTAVACCVALCLLSLVGRAGLTYVGVF